MRALALLLAAGATLAAPAQGPQQAQVRVQELRRFELKVQPPDYIFHFQPRPELPGRPKVVLVLSGGGARGIAHLGLLQRLDEEGYPIDGIVGTSIGAMMGGLYSAGFSGKEIEELFRQVDFSKAFLDPLRRQPGSTLGEQEESSAAILSLRTEGGAFTLAQGLQSGKPVQRALEGLFARAAYFSQGRFDDLKVPLRILSTNLETGQGRVFQQGDLVEVVRASMAMPGGFEPVLIDGQQFVDGALVENLPVDVARANFKGAFLLASDISSPFEQRRGGNFLSIAARSLDLMIERRQWESRDHADFLLRPVLKDASFTDYGPQMNALVEAGRRTFDAHHGELNAKLLARFELMEPLGTKALRLDVPEPLPARAQATLDRFLPAGHDPTSDDVNIILQQLLVHGWAQQAWATVDEGTGGAGRVLTLHARPWPVIQDVRVEAPPERLGKLAEAVRSTMYVGDRFNPEVFGNLLSNLVHGLVLEGSPLADVRGSGFDPATGLVTVRLREPLVQRIEMRPQEGARLHTEYLESLMGDLMGHPLRIDALQRNVALGEQRLSLGELRVQEKPLATEGGEEVELDFVPVPEHKQSLDVTVGYESTLGGQLGLAYTSRNLGGSGVELALEGARNRLEREAEATLRGPFRFFPGAGLELRAAWTHDRLEPLFAYPNEELPGTPFDATIETLEGGFGGFLRFGATGTGKLGLEAEWRRSRYDAEGGPGQGVNTDRIEHLALGSLEWDNFDRHTLPRQGLLLRLRAGLGQSKDGPHAGEGFQLGYGRLRFLQPLGERVGLDLNLEGGLGHQLPLDRWWPFGGGAQLLGSQARGILAPNLASASIGLPLRFFPGLGLILELEPRVDAARFAAGSNELGRSVASRATSMGLVARTALSQFYVEAAFGFLKLQAPGLDGRTHGRVDILVGTQPFDLWKHH